MVTPTHAVLRVATNVSVYNRPKNCQWPHGHTAKPSVTL